MAFFDQLGRKASAATAKAMQKAQEVSGTVKLNSLIAEEERRIEGLYSQIGKLYMSVHREDCEEQFAGMVGAISSSENKIIDYREQIQALKNTLRCEKCGAEIAGDALFCTSCGTPVQKYFEQTEPADGPRCIHCGAAVTSEMLFCTSCGHPLEAPSARSEVTVESASGEIVVERLPGEDSGQIDVAPVQHDAQTADGLQVNTPSDAEQERPEAGQTGEEDSEKKELIGDTYSETTQVQEHEPPLDETDKFTLEPVSEQQLDLPSEAPGEAKTPHKVCPNCGANVNEDDLFCYECGAKL